MITSNDIQIQEKKTQPQGSALLVVVTMMTALMFMGLFFMVIVNTERNNSAAFAAPDEVTESNEDYMEFALEQLIIGPDSTYKHSALYTGQHSILPNMLGRFDFDSNSPTEKLKPTDLHPFSSRGVHVLFTDLNSDGIPDDMNFGFDTNGDNVAETTTTTNYSAAANSGAPVPSTYHPDAGYTYPDINSMFLAHYSWVDVDPNPTVTNMKFVLIPSFFRPQYHERTAIPAPYGSTGFAPTSVLRPHQLHISKSGSTSEKRYVTVDGTDINGTFLNKFPFPDTYNNGVWTKNPSTVTVSDYELDVDNDGDGVKDGILIDLDYPIQTDTATGNQYVPIFSFLVLDADGLPNLNVAGNMNNIKHPYTGRFGHYIETSELLGLSTRADGNGFLSRSNHGLSFSELNIGRMLVSDPQNTLYADTADVDSFLKQYQGMFSFTGTATTQMQLSNMELARIMLGAPKYNTTTLALDGNIVTPGRFGTDNDLSPDKKDLLIHSLTGSADSPPYPVAGGVNKSAMNGAIDDDGDFNNPGLNTDDNPAVPSLGFSGGAPYYDRNLNNLMIPWFGHPLDYTGMSSLYSIHANGKSFSLVKNTADSLNPQTYLQYFNGMQDIGIMTDPLVTSSIVDNKLLGVSNYYHGFSSSGYLIPNMHSWTLNEEDEVIADPNKSDYSKDSLFDIEQLAELHLTQNDMDILGNVSSRMRDLLPFNFSHNKMAPEIRKQFTTLSMDRREFSLTNNFDNGSATLNRTWEFNNDQSNPGKHRFPPLFGTPAIAPNSASDPLRPEVRQLLSVEHGKTDSTSFLPQRRLNINKLIDIDPSTSKPRYRRLTPHPVITVSTTFSSTELNNLHSVTAPTYNAEASQKDQEWWARYDRQRMARDIYSLLWILGGAANINYVDGSNVYSAEAARQMAQFAVNLVDSMDQDNVITKFEYDENLTDGWSNAVTQYKAVYGNERQELTLSEVMWIVAGKNTNSSDHKATLWDDTTRDHQFMFIELRNTTPNEVTLGDGTYRIRSVSHNGTPNVLSDDTEIGKVTFQKGTGTAAKISAGSNFLLGTHDGSWKVTGGVDAGKTQAAAFRVDLDWNNDGSFDSNFRSIAPYKEDISVVVTSNDYPVPLCDFDLCYEGTTGSSARNKQWFKEYSSSPDTTFGYLLAPVTDVPASTEYQIVLERRMNIQCNDKLDDASNEWIEIDRFTIDAKEQAAPDDSTDPKTIYDNTTGGGFVSFARSKERAEPFDPSTPVDFTGGNKLYRHTLGGPKYDDTVLLPQSLTNYSSTRLNQQNSNGAATNRFYQPHFDRDYHSVMELLSVPIYGPGKSGDKVNPLIYGASANLENPRGLVNPSNMKMDGHATAQAKFLNLDLTGTGATSTDTFMYTNRWYRLLNFVYVDSTTQANILNDVDELRIPGRVNLNTIRTTGQNLHLGTIGALIDDDYHQGNFTTLDPHEYVASNGTRDWAQQFLFARDGIDIYSAVNYSAYLPLPGVPGSKPFRALDYIDPKKSHQSLEHTILRPIPYVATGSIPGLMTENYTAAYDGNMFNSSGTANDRRGLFEARTYTDLASNSVDYYSRNRILSKVDNLSTIRSNVFYVWVTVQFHEAAVDTNGNTVIGSKLDKTPWRGFFVIDRSNPENAYDSATRTFDYSKMVVLKRMIQR